MTLRYARRNLTSPEARARLEKLLAKVEILVEAPGERLPRSVRLAEKDQPILRAAVAGRATISSRATCATSVLSSESAFAAS